MTTVTQAIETRYMRPTNTRGGRIKAIAWGGNITIPYPHDLSTDDAHRAAAQALIDKLGWTGDFAQGGAAKGDGYYFVNVNGA
jgi:hypothetical protein